MSDPNYIKRIQIMRERNVLARTKGKPLIFREPEILDLMILNKIPACMQHCIVKVHSKMQGNGHERFISAVNICAAVFQKYGYMKLGSTVLTGKGLRNNTRHRLEVDAGRKKAQYETLKNLLWRGYIDRREKQLRSQRQGESASPLENVRQSKPATKTVVTAPPSTNVIGAKSPVTSTAKISSDKGLASVSPKTNVRLRKFEEE